MTELVDVVVIGAGVVGLAVGRAFAQAGREVLVLEKNGAFGEETSARNSEVIHAGLYYKPGSNRALLCAPGKVMLYDYCQEHLVEFQNCEKLIVAHDDGQIEKLHALKAQSEANGVLDLEVISGVAARGLEPNIACKAALHSPSTGIVDSHGLMLSLLGEIEDNSGFLVLNAPVEGGFVEEDGVTLAVGGVDPMSIKARLVINCGGLWADRVARHIEGVPTGMVPTIHYGKGQYFAYTGKTPFSRLIYPMPTADSLGAHYTRDLGGQGRLGPDITYVETNIDYDVDETKRDQFAADVRQFWPDLDPERLQPGYAGIRPKAAPPGEEADFIFHGRETHGIESYIGLYGIASPGLTSCLAIARHVLNLAS